MKLERLTQRILARFEKRGKTAGWYQLCAQGYTPQEIAIYAEPCVYYSDVRQRVRDYADSKNLPVPASCARIREARLPVAELDWREAFRKNVMRTGLQLALSQPMLEYLCATADGVRWDRGYMEGSSMAKPSCCIVTSASLAKRGLVRRKPFHGSRPDGDSHDELTEAGEHVVALLKSVGIFIEADRAIERKVGRATR